MAAVPKPWLETTAAWALLAPPCAQTRDFAHFAMEAMGEIGAKASVVRVAEALLAKPCKSDMLRNLGDIEAVAKAYVAVGSLPRARAAVARLEPLEWGQRKKADAAFVKNRRVELSRELGLDGKTRSAKKPSAGERERRRTVGEILRDVNAAFAELTPDEWNVHNAAGDLSRAVCELQERGQTKKASAVFERACAAFATGVHDGRGFASGGAYVELSRAAFVVHGRAHAIPFLEKAVAVSGKHRQMILSDVSLAYGAMDLVDAGLVFARKVRPEARRVKTVAELLYRAGAWKPLAMELARVRDPEVGARTAWALACIALERD